ncbi:CoA-transferase family III [Colletotrichum higginsianum]|uniref:CoA-transferase family III n=2 Tax=Colletotrichum higginsianum TaxID=80884 RepID=H1V451_COLHI|nr:CoA-transferase family III [Colletotrichum higginsianum IMI 349063]OBR14577.1 CoA-transferase family III [Colletotrichum higginsianum IMI 349063]TID01883.1 CaiB/baiF CoA-transferase family protein [Colletotrichum higginsianum]CCF35003.1 CoA-transferase family III [Colletotrichum higginsianum]
MDRSTFSPTDIVQEVWAQLGLPKHATSALKIDTTDGPVCPSSFKIVHLAQSSIALSALTSGLVHSLRNGNHVPRVSVPHRHALAEFKSERLYEIEGEPPQSTWGNVGGLHKTLDGHVRIHDSFPHHRLGTLRLLQLHLEAGRDDVASKTKLWRSIDLETAGIERGLAIYALRTYDEWDAHPQSAAIANQPILLGKLGNGPKGFPGHLSRGTDRCLRGLRVVELSRVIAAPVAGKTLAAHGADVLWVTSPNLPGLPPLDREFSRGKRTIQLDIGDPSDKARLLELLRTADVFIQGYRPGSLAAHGLSPAELAAANPGLVVANLSAFGPDGPWSGRRGFDSLVQTCSGMNVSEAEHFGAGEPARPMPCQALDHGAGYFLASGISAALYKRATEGGSWVVNVSLGGVMKYLRSLGQYAGKTGFEAPDITTNLPENLFERRETDFGMMKYLKHSATVEGHEPGWDVMPKILGTDEPRWLS